MEGHSNKTWDELHAGDEAVIERTVAERDIVLFSHASGNLNPMHMPGIDVDGDGKSDTNPSRPSASAGFFRIERSVLNLAIVRRLTSSRCSRLDWFHSNNAALCEREHLVAKAFAVGP